MNPTANFLSLPLRAFPFIRFTNWKQDFEILVWPEVSSLVSIHTLHELEASLRSSKRKKRKWSFHSYASRIGSKFLRKYYPNEVVARVSIHTLHELEARRIKNLYERIYNTRFPFIRFTNWKQVAVLQLHGGSYLFKMFPFIRFTNWKQA